MQPQFSNLVNSSFFLWLDHEILSRQAYTNVDSKLYPLKTKYNGLQAFSAPFSQWVSDNSINGANVPTGLYLNSFFCPIGTSGLVGINYEKGQAYFSTGLSSTVQISGRYAVKDINITAPKVDISFLMKTKPELRPKITQNYNSLTGLADNEFSYPAIYVRSFAGDSEPYCFGGIQNTKNTIGCFIFCNNEFLIDAATSILQDREHDYIPLLSANEMPFNILGSFKNNIPYNYTGITYNKIGNCSGIFIEDVTITDFSSSSFDAEIQALPADVFFRVAEFKLSFPRQT